MHSFSSSCEIAKFRRISSFRMLCMCDTPISRVLLGVVCVLIKKIDRRLPLGLQCSSHCYVCHQTMCGAHMMSDNKTRQKMVGGEKKTSI